MLSAYAPGVEKLFGHSSQNLREFAGGVENGRFRTHLAGLPKRIVDVSKQCLFTLNGLYKRNPEAAQAQFDAWKEAYLQRIREQDVSEEQAEDAYASSCASPAAAAAAMPAPTRLLRSDSQPLPPFRQGSQGALVIDQPAAAGSPHFVQVLGPRVRWLTEWETVKVALSKECAKVTGRHMTESELTWCVIYVLVSGSPLQITPTHVLSVDSDACVMQMVCSSRRLSSDTFTPTEQSGLPPMESSLVTAGTGQWVDSNTFERFWSWYCDALEAISAVRHLHEHRDLLFQPFVSPSDCFSALTGRPEGTFIVRLSRSFAGEVAVTYVRERERGEGEGRDSQ
jgi:hypothetical protein